MDFHVNQRAPRSLSERAAMQASGRIRRLLAAGAPLRTVLVYDKAKRGALYPKLCLAAKRPGRAYRARRHRPRVRRANRARAPGEPPCAPSDCRGPVVAGGRVSFLLPAPCGSLFQGES
jgi:hypothetical protein